MTSAGTPNPALGLQPVQATPDLPAEADVVVIGGGIVGVTAAWHLADRGLRVALCEKGVIGGEQSGRNWGWCRYTLRDPREIPLMKVSMRDWQDPVVFGRLDTGFRVTGIMYFSGRTAGDGEMYARWLQSVRPFDLDGRILAPAEIDTLVPGCTETPTGGALYTPSDGCAEPGWAAPAIARNAQAKGATIHTRCAVRGLETTAGRLSAVVTELGTIRCRSAVLAGGAWSRLFARNLGLSLPALNVRGSVSMTPPMPGGPEVSVVGRRFGWRKRADGGYVVSQADATLFDLVPDCLRLFRPFLPIMRTGLKQLRLRLGRKFVEELLTPGRWNMTAVTPFEHTRMADPEPSRAVLDQAAARLAEAVPFFRGARIAARWGGYIDVTPDAIPVIGPCSSIDGLVFATGFSGHGFGLGPGGGRLAADIVAGTMPAVDIHPYRPSRFGL